MRRLKNPDVGFVAGWAMLVAGCAAVSVALGLIVGGVALVALSFAAGLGSDSK